MSSRPLSLVRERTAARPGPGPTPPALLRALDITVGRRMQGLVPGEHRTPGAGVGTELASVRPYQPGDDVRRLDAAVTARTGVPHVRAHVPERAITTWLLLDVSPSMSFGTADRRKADVAEGAALAVGHIATRWGDHMGVLTFGDRRTRATSPRTGRAGLLGVLTSVAREPVTAAVGQTSLGDALARAGRLARSRGVVAVVSDFRGPRDWRRALLALRGRHDVICLEVRDPREQALPAVGELLLVDPETGRQLRVDTSRRKLRERFAAEADAERSRLARELRRAGAEHVVLSTHGDWLRGLAVHMSRARRSRANPRPRRAE